MESITCPSCGIVGTFSHYEKYRCEYCQYRFDSTMDETLHPFNITIDTDQEFVDLNKIHEQTSTLARHFLQNNIPSIIPKILEISHPRDLEKVDTTHNNKISLTKEEILGLIRHDPITLCKYLNPMYFSFENTPKTKSDALLILEKLAEGTYSKIFKAKDIETGTLYGMKILKLYQFERTIRENILEKFMFEFKVGQISSNHVLKSYNKGFVYDNPYILLELADGGDLISLVRENLPIEVINKIAIDILKGIICLHENKIIHRDIKPHNILLVGDNFKIGDFNVSTFKYNKEVLSVPTLNETGIVETGTYGYMAPELYNSKAKEMISEKNDIFSFGCTMFQVITGGFLPFGLIKNEIDAKYYYYNAKNGIYRSILGYRKDFPYYWEEIIKKCLQPNPDGRFGNAEEILFLLKNNYQESVRVLDKKLYENPYTFDVFLCFSKLDRLFALEIISFLEIRGLKILISNSTLDNTQGYSNSNARFFLALYTENFTKEEKINAELSIVSSKPNKKAIIYNALLDSNIDTSLANNCIVINSKKEILYILGIEEPPKKPMKNASDEPEPNIREKILRRIAQYRIKESISFIHEYFTIKNIKGDAYETICILSGQYKRLEKKQIQGISNSEEYRREENEIIVRLNKFAMDYFDT